MALEVRYEWGIPTGALEVHRRVVLGTEIEGGEVTLDLDALLTGRLLIQGPSGSGKTTLLRRLISQCAQTLQWLAVDPEGEHAALKPLAITAQPRPTELHWSSATHLALLLRQNRRSTVLDISDLNREQQLIYLTKFIQGLIEVPRDLWSRRCLVVVDEVEIFTPTDMSAFHDPSVGKRSRSALIDLMSRGRKRGLITALATHRLPQLAASVRAEARNFLIGGSSFDVDIERAAAALGWSRSRALAILPKLKTGQFVAVGMAFSKSPAIVEIPGP